MVLVGSLTLALCCLTTFIFAKAILHWAGEKRTGVTLAFTTTLLYAIPNLTTPLLGGLRAALVLQLVLGVAGVAVLFGVGGPGGEAKSSVKLPRWALIVLLPLSLLVVWAAVAGYFWDEERWHNALVAVMARGVVPPEYPLFPGEAFRYHYAFDLLGAELRALTGMSVDRAIDVVTVLLFGMLLLVAKDAGAALAGRTGATLSTILVPFGGGTLQFLVFGDVAWLNPGWSAIPKAFNDRAAPPLISNLFQHPQAVGMVVSLAVLLLFLDGRDDRGSWRRRAVGAFLMGALANGHAVFFAVTGVALAVGCVIAALKARSVRSLAFDAALGAAALGFAKVSGGFFAPGPKVESLMTIGTGLYAGESAGTVAFRLLVYLGLPLILLPLSIIGAVKKKDPLWLGVAAAAVFGFAVPIFVSYKHSWDVVKFFSAGNLAANLLLASILARVQGRRLLVAFAIVLTNWTGFVWLMRSTVFDGRYGVPKNFYPGPNRTLMAVGDALDPLLSPHTKVYAIGPGLGIASGILTPGFDPNAWAQGHADYDTSKHRAWAAAALAARTSLDPGALAVLGVEVIVLSPADRRALGPDATQALADATRFEPLLEIPTGEGVYAAYRIVPPPAAR